MNTKIVIRCLVFAFEVLAMGQRLAAQVTVTPLVPNGQATVLSGTLTATTSTGQDVTGGFTVVVGQPIPTVTFGFAGSAPVESWVFFTLLAIAG